MLPEVEQVKTEMALLLHDKDAAEQRLVQADAAIAALERACTDRERCGNCKHGTNRYSHARFWVANCGAGLHPDGFVKAHDRCHFIDAEHPHGRWELCHE